ncbi:MAG: PPC domain-containing protein, partial [Rivularia sp. (in: Bacteria)]|nr:PPC domain-containing protein [Rivularia sp. MS3]
PIPSPRRSTPPPTQQRIEPQPVPIPSPRRSTPLPQQSPIKSPISISSKPNFKKINFVEIELGVLAPNDYKYQGKYYDFYQFEGRENQLIQLRMIGSDDKRDSSNLSLNPVVMLLDSDNKVIAVRSNRNTSEDVNDAFMFVRLPSKGTYTIAVTSKNPGDIGRYSLAMRNDRASYTLDEFGMLTQQKPILKQNRTAYNVSQFQGSKGQLISIRADSNYEQFSPYIVLLNSKGEIVASDNAKDGKYSALIDRVELPDNGTYYVVVTSSTSKKTGTYRLSIF